MDGKKLLNNKYLMGSISLTSIDMEISSPRHLFEILKTISELFCKLSLLEDKFEIEMNKHNVPEDNRIAVHYHMVSGEIAEFKFE